MSDKILEFARRVVWVLGIIVASTVFAIIIDWWWER